MATPIKLPVGARGIKSSPKQIEYLKNLIYVQGDSPSLMFRPSVESLASGFGTCRGMGRFRNLTTGEEELYTVSGDRLLKVTLNTGFPSEDLRPSDVQLDVIGIIPGDENCVLVASFTNLMVLRKGSSAYSWDGTTLKTHTDGVDFYKDSISVTYDSGRFVFVPADGSPFFWTDTGSNPPTFSADNYADAEEQPDPNKAIIERKDSIYVLGTRTIEQERYDSTKNVYVKVGGGDTSVGYVGGLTKFGESFAFLGQGENGGFQFYVMGQEAQALTNSAINEKINNEYALVDLENIEGRSFIWKGITILLFYLPNETLCYYGDWSSWSSKGRDTWRINFIEYAYGYLWTGDSISNTVGYLKDEGIDYNVENQWEFRTFLKSLPRKNFIISRIYADATAGVFGTEQIGEDTVRIDKQSYMSLQVSRDAYTFSDDNFRALGEIGDYSKEISWGSPVIKADNYCGIIVKGYGSALINVDGLYFD